MYRGRRIAVVMPSFNVDAYLAAAVRSVPSFVDDVIVVDDCSDDGTATQVERLQRSGLVHLRHRENRGVGAAIATGYSEALRRRARVVVVMAGDGQMDPDDLEGLLDPIIDGRADYAKGNRFGHPDVWRAMPPARLLGNVVLSLLTKLTSGYRRVFDSQCGYTAASARTIRAVGCGFFSRYGYPNDLLARLRTVGARVVDVPVRPVYEGQGSGIRPWTVIYPMLFVLFGSFVWRIWTQYVTSMIPGRAAPSLSAPADDAEGSTATVRSR